jgi:hypothetical protein
MRDSYAKLGLALDKKFARVVAVWQRSKLSGAMQDWRATAALLSQLRMAQDPHVRRLQHWVRLILTRKSARRWRTARLLQEQSAATLLQVGCSLPISRTSGALTTAHPKLY